MESERYQRVERLFHEALALAPDDRSIHIDHGAAGDADVAARVRRMISFAERPSATAGILENSSPAGHDMDEASTLLGARLGPYRLLEIIGAGGFGVVYRAEQEQPIRRSVALKILRGGMDSRQVITRFEGERQALALMEHPNIARVLDAGRTPPNLGLRPYFVMELVGGLPLTEYCDSKRLDAEARLDLFLTICDAVQHAHQKGIIHRDLKPSNIVVAEIGGKPVPKIIDFGIAKALEQRLTERTLVTDARQLLGTPQYMSPEQADMGAGGIDTRSDIYSLGVILYELLTGTTPRPAAALHQASYTQMQRLIQSDVVERPSTRVTRNADDGEGDADRTDRAQRRGTNVASLQRRLRGDLDWITLKALEHDRERRYASASALADDIRRHQRHEPVQAGPPSAAYRTRKFVRRHRLSVLAVSLVTLAVIAGSVGTTFGMLRARDSAEQARAVNAFMLEILSSADANERGADVRLAAVLHSASTTASDRFARHPRVEAEVREMLGRVFVSLDLAAEASAEFNRAVELRSANFGQNDPRTLGARLMLAQSLMYGQRIRESDGILDDLVPRLERVLGPDDVLTLRGQYLWSGAQRRQGRVAASESMLRSLRVRLTDLKAPEDLQIAVLDSLLLAVSQRLHESDPVDPQAMLEARNLCDELVRRSISFAGPDAVPTVHARVMLAKLMRLDGDSAAAAEISRSVLESSTDHLGECHLQLQIAMNVLARACCDLGAHSEAADLYLRIIECAKKRAPGSLQLAVSLSDALPYLERGGRWSEGEAAAREFVSVVHDIGGSHGDMMFNADLSIARFAMLQGRITEAERLLAALESRRDEFNDAVTLARLDLTHGQMLQHQGRLEQAEERLQQAASRLGDISKGTSPADRDDLINAFITLYRAWGKPERAGEYQRMLSRSDPAASEGN